MAPNDREAFRTRIVRWAAVFSASIMFGTAAALHDLSALLVALAMAAGVVWLWLRPGAIGPAVVAVVVLADVVFFMGTAALSNLRNGGGIIAIAIPAAVAVTALIAFLAATAVLAMPPVTRAFSLAPAAGARAGAAIGVVVACVMGLAPHLRVGGALPGDLVVGMKTTAYSPRAVRARAEDSWVFVSNEDLFWHTFTIDALHVDVSLPVGGGRRFHLNARPGRYEYYCRVPGHRAAGMKGTLVVPTPQ
jgi:plastocyanin